MAYAIVPVTSDSTIESETRRRALHRLRLPANFVLVSWRDLAVIVLPVVIFICLVVWVALRFVHPAPLDTIVIASGPDNSTFRTTAEKYRKIIERNGVKVKILSSQGGLDNLHKLADPASGADVGFVQGGLSEGVDIEHLRSLGSLFTQPLLVFYRGTREIEELSQLRGKRLAIGLEG